MTASPPAPADQVAAVSMTLAGIAYGHPLSIPGYLAEDKLTCGDWTIFWCPTTSEIPANFAFVAQSASTGDYCLAIRGTYPNPFSPAYWEDANQDNPLGPMQPWPYERPRQGALISNGTSIAFRNLMALTNGTLSLRQAMETIPLSAKVTVTGHSLGGTLAPVIALWMTTLRPGDTLNAYSFAGMTPGNRAFASLFDEGTPLFGHVRRYKNTLDSVPYGWNDIRATRNFYQPAPNGGLLVEAIIDTLAIKLLGYDFTPIGQEVLLQGSLSPQLVGCELIAFVIENLRQHLPDTYLDLLGAPPLPFTLGFGSVVVPHDHATVEQIGKHRLPVYYL